MSGLQIWEHRRHGRALQLRAPRASTKIRQPRRGCIARPAHCPIEINARAHPCARIHVSGLIRSRLLPDLGFGNSAGTTLPTIWAAPLRPLLVLDQIALTPMRS
jgi:hypothetical protein